MRMKKEIDVLILLWKLFGPTANGSPERYSEPPGVSRPHLENFCPRMFWYVVEEIDSILQNQRTEGNSLSCSPPQLSYNAHSLAKWIRNVSCSRARYPWEPQTEIWTKEQKCCTHTLRYRWKNKTSLQFFYLRTLSLQRMAHDGGADLTQELLTRLKPQFNRGAIYSEIFSPKQEFHSKVRSQLHTANL